MSKHDGSFLLYKEDYKGCKIKINQEEYNDQNPRTEWDNAGVMVCRHSRYDLGDKHQFKTPDDFLEWVKESKEVLYMLPLYLYDHSGITISTGDFGDIWDSGQIGFIYLTKETAKKEFPTHRGSSLKKKVLALLESEVKVYDHYLTGDVCCWNTEDEDGDSISGCCGYFGFTENKNYMIDEAKSSIDYYLKEKRKAVRVEATRQREWSYML